MRFQKCSNRWQCVRLVLNSLKLLPEWYRAVDLYGSTWTRPVVDDDIGKHATGGGENSFAASLAGNVIGEVLSNLLG